jgi:hypothetical protein
MTPLASQEVRWFFEGKSADHGTLRHWFETTDPLHKGTSIGAPIWKGRLDDQPNVYLLVPGCEDMGIKWRERELQVKGRVSDLGGLLPPASRAGCFRNLDGIRLRAAALGAEDRS